MSLKKKSSTFEFSKPYIDNEGRKQTARIILTIDYQANLFIISDYDSTLECRILVNQPQLYNKWKALLQLEDEAMEFANNELGIVK